MLAGSLEVLPFEMLLVQRHRGNRAPGNEEMAMAHATDPPSVERKSAGFWKWARDILRRLVNRKTLMTAFLIVLWAVRIARLLKQLFGGL